MLRPCRQGAIRLTTAYQHQSSFARQVESPAPGQLRLARAHGYECMLGSAYPHDPMHPPVWYIRWL